MSDELDDNFDYLEAWIFRPSNSVLHASITVNGKKELARQYVGKRPVEIEYDGWRPDKMLGVNAEDVGWRYKRPKAVEKNKKSKKK